MFPPFDHTLRNYIPFGKISVFMNNFDDVIKGLSKSPGIYKFLSSAGEVLYVGKAKNLRTRVGSYFKTKLDARSKTCALVQNISDIDYIEVFSEIEALILEARLIKEYSPHYNIVLKDDKSFLYIEIIDEFFKIDGVKVNFPRVKVSRKPDLAKSSLRFGPFPSSKATKFVLRSLRKHFLFRDCSKSKYNSHTLLKRPCLYGDIGLCTAPCVGAISSENYFVNISHLCKFLSGQSEEILLDLQSKMEVTSRNQDYENAVKYRDLIQDFNYVREMRIPAELYEQNPDLKEDLAEKSLELLLETLPVLSVPPKRIECYDISELSGTDSVGSMVVAIDGNLVSSLYRRFKIRLVDVDDWVERRGRGRIISTKDDSAKLAEVLERRFARMKKEIANNGGVMGWEKPDLVVLDGGRPQIRAGLKVLKAMDVLDVPLIGLAKKEETIVYYYQGKFSERKLKKSNEGLQLLIRLRDEAHRFAQDYHHRLRVKELLAS